MQIKFDIYWLGLDRRNCPWLLVPNPIELGDGLCKHDDSVNSNYYIEYNDKK